MVDDWYFSTWQLSMPLEFHWQLSNWVGLMKDLKNPIKNEWMFQKKKNSRFILKSLFQLWHDICFLRKNSWKINCILFCKTYVMSFYPHFFVKRGSSLWLRSLFSQTKNFSAERNLNFELQDTTNQSVHTKWRRLAPPMKRIPIQHSKKESFFIMLYRYLPAS